MHQLHKIDIWFFEKEFRKLYQNRLKSVPYDTVSYNYFVRTFFIRRKGPSEMHFFPYGPSQPLLPPPLLSSPPISSAEEGLINSRI